MNEKQVHFTDLEELSAEAAVFVQTAAAQAISEKGYFTLVLAGGGTPKGLYRKLAQPPVKDAIDWNRVYIFWGDERCVPFSHEFSNYRMSKESLLDHVPIPAENIFPMPVGAENPEQEESTLAEKGAREYGDTITRFFREKGAETTIFDFTLLGMGDDGHTASLFPGDSLVQEEEHITGFVNAINGKPPCYRVSLTFPLINQSRQVLFLIGGGKKIDILKQVTAEGGREKGVFPVERVQPAGDLVWFVSEG